MFILNFHYNLLSDLNSSVSQIFYQSENSDWIGLSGSLILLVGQLRLKLNKTKQVRGWLLVSQYIYSKIIQI